MTLKDVSDGGVNEACKQAIEAMLARGHKVRGEASHLVEMTKLLCLIYCT